MFRRTLCSFALAGLMATVALAETYGEKVKAIDADKKTVTIPVDGKEIKLPIDATAKFEQQMKAGKRLRNVPMKDGLKGVKAGDNVVITTELKDGKETVTRIVVNLPDTK